MSKSSAASKTVSKSSAASTRVPTLSGKSQQLFTLTLRLLLLVVGAVLAFAAGVGIAQFYPAANPQMPFWEKAFRRSENLATGTKQLSPLPTPIPSPLPNLTPEQTKQLRSELNPLQTQLNDLIGRTAALETKLGNSRPTETLERRLQLLSQQLGTQEETPATDASTEMETPQASDATAGNAAQPASAAGAALPNNALMVTLPSDVLFVEGGSALRPQTQVILDNLIADLRNYPGASVRIGAHTDDVGNFRDNQVLSFRRAQALLAYLTGTLGTQYHWVVMGYGESRPVAENNSDINRQRNRRVEIAIEPKAGR